MAADNKSDKKKTRVTAASLRAMTLDDLQKKLSEEEEELMRARFKHATANLENTAELKTKRRFIARIATILNEKEKRVQ